MKNLSVIVIIALIAASLFLNVTRWAGHEPEVIVKRDTIVLRDTVHVTPEPLKEIPIRIDTVYHPEIIYVDVGEAEKEPQSDGALQPEADPITLTYVDVLYENAEYKATVSGYKYNNVSPTLSSLDIYKQTNEVHIDTKYQPRWGLGVQVGATFMNGNISPYIGVGVQYNLITW